MFPLLPPHDPRPLELPSECHPPPRATCFGGFPRLLGQLRASWEALLLGSRGGYPPARRGAPSLSSLPSLSLQGRGPRASSGHCMCHSWFPHSWCFAPRGASRVPDTGHSLTHERTASPEGDCGRGGPWKGCTMEELPRMQRKLRKAGRVEAQSILRFVVLAGCIIMVRQVNQALRNRPESNVANLPALST